MRPETAVCTLIEQAPWESQLWTTGNSALKETGFLSLYFTGKCQDSSQVRRPWIASHVSDDPPTYRDVPIACAKATASCQGT